MIQSQLIKPLGTQDSEGVCGMILCGKKGMKCFFMICCKVS